MLSDPIGSAKAVVPDAAAPLAEGATRALYVGTGGDLTVRMTGDVADVTFKNIAVGWHPLRVTHVRASSTAADIVALR